MDVVEMLVRMDCKGCERTVRKSLSRIRGIESVEVDMNLNKVTVRGYVDRMMVLRAIRRAGKKAEFWNPTHQPDYYLHLPNAYGYDYPNHSHAFESTYNYERHGYNVPYSHYYSQYLNRPQDGVSTLFSDDNPNSCSVM
ncbi:hypothetical protein GOP47_0009373 [Adiantum capillus-veneris]|uniref:HMA domain-containing protein n=1 Tax=Adiantum capillus-veneris TaxID=13818 RepID=A0A9D4UXN4_ADICA|nr:hypothetical protein GOP47_0009373 [Adiantum capillus-veneris]